MTLILVLLTAFQTYPYATFPSYYSQHEIFYCLLDYFRIFTSSSYFWTSSVKTFNFRYYSNGVCCGNHNNPASCPNDCLNKKSRRWGEYSDLLQHRLNMLTIKNNFKKISHRSSYWSLQSGRFWLAHFKQHRYHYNNTTHQFHLYIRDQNQFGSIKIGKPSNIFWSFDENFLPICSRKKNCRTYTSVVN